MAARTSTLGAERSVSPHIREAKAALAECSGPFASAALDLLVSGLAVLPCGGEDGKRPLIKGFNRWNRPQERVDVERLILRFGGQNIGYATGRASRITVLDIDEPTEAERFIARYTPPFVIRTPRGGVHIPHRFDGEPCANLRPRGLSADIKGSGGFVVAPPSEGPSGARYRIEQGTWADVMSLPELPPEIRDLVQKSPPVSPFCSAGDKAVRELILSPGERNNRLFRMALRLAGHARSEDELTRQLLARNQARCRPPLSDAEVANVARSAWGYQEDGKNSIAGRHRYARVDKDDACILFREDCGPSSLLLLLRATHSADHIFSVSPRALSENYGASEGAVRRARDKLVRLGHLEVVRAGVQGRRHSAQYRLTPR